MAEIKIFFSWQSNILVNKPVISQALELAVGEINADWSDSGNRLIIDDATREVPGAPDICDAIIKKIREADIFIGDVTPIMEEKDIVNSNVMFELGYAVCFLGWYRVILLFNKKFGCIEESLPFDIRKNRITTFSAENAEGSIIGNVKKILKDAINPILSANPKKSFEIWNIQDEKRKRDIDNLEWVFSNVFYLNAWDSFFNDYPTAHWDSLILTFWDIFVSLYQSGYWNFYDDFLKEKFAIFTDRLQHLFETALPLTQSTIRGRIIPTDYWTDQQQKQYNETINWCIEAQTVYKDILDYIRQSYIEVNIDMLSYTAKKKYDNA